MKSWLPTFTLLLIRDGVPIKVVLRKDGGIYVTRYNFQSLAEVNLGFRNREIRSSP